MKKLIKNSVFALAALSLGHLGYTYFNNYTPTPQPVAMQDHAQYVQKSLSQEEEALWDLITTTTGVTKEQCLYDRQNYDQKETEFNKKTNQEMLKNAKKISLSTQQLIKKVLQDFNINPDSIDIVPIKTDLSPAGADDWTLYIDEERLLSYTKDAQYFILGHELAHITYKDISLRSALGRLLSKQGKKAKKMTDLYHCFQEKRADMLAIVKGEKYKKGSICFLESLQKIKGEGFGPPTHPKLSDRINLAKYTRSCNNLSFSSQNNATLIAYPFVCL